MDSGFGSSLSAISSVVPLFFFNDTATTEIYTLSLHDALPIFRSFDRSRRLRWRTRRPRLAAASRGEADPRHPRAREAPLSPQDRKSTRLNSSHANISYAVFCLTKKKGRNVTGRRTGRG